MFNSKFHARYAALASTSDQLSWKRALRATAVAAAVAICSAGGAAANITFTEVASGTGNGCTGGGPNATDIEGLNPGNISSGGCSYNGSQAIVKYDNFGNGTYGDTVVNTATFSKWVDTWITFNFEDGDNSKGTWSYDPGNDPNPIGITAVYFKGGNNNNGGGVDLYESMYQLTQGVPYYGGDGLAFAFDTGGPAVSNVVFFDTIASVPVPAGLPLLALGLGGLAYAARRQRKSAAA